MKLSSKMIIPTLAITLAGAGLLYSAQPAQAQTQTTPDGFHQLLIQKLATKFNVSESDVQTVFTEVRSSQHQKMEQKMLERLNQAVADGKLTETQKQAVIAKHAELHQERENNREAMKDLSPADRRAAMEQHRNELATWAKNQGIDLEYLTPMAKMPMMKKY